MGKRIKRSVGAPYLVDDLLIEILSRLPTKSLRRFFCVSKSWNNYISSLSWKRISGLFIWLPESKKGIHISTGPPHYQEEFESRLRSLPFYSSFRVIHGCNGLLLFARNQHRISPCLYYVWNPATMEFVALPTLPTRSYSPKYCFLAYDPRESPCYKVVRFSFTKKFTSIIVEIFSSVTRRWSRLSLPIEEILTKELWIISTIFHKGDLYMLPEAYILPEANLDYIICFDINKRSFNLIDLPEKRPEFLSEIHECLGESRGHMYYAANFCTQFELKIYMLEQLDAIKWILMHKISTKNEISSHWLRPIALHPESEVIYLSISNKILAFHPCSRKFDEVQYIDYKDTVYAGNVSFITPCLESILQGEV